jgi:TonB family protein
MNATRQTTGHRALLVALPLALLATLPASGDTLNTPPLAARDTSEKSLLVHPEFPGGLKALQKFLRKEIYYPDDALLLNVQDNVLVQFIVGKDGHVREVQAIKYNSTILSEEAVRVVKRMPRWKPGTKDGQPVSERYILPVTFALEIPPPPVDVDVLPQFPGGKLALGKFIDTEMQYPPKALQKGVQGRAIVQFLVKADGSIDNVSLLSSVNRSLDREAIRLVRAMPRWTPGQSNGKAVGVYIALAVTFKLPGQDLPLYPPEEP